MLLIFQCAIISIDLGYDTLVQLEWVTASEINSNHFEVERSRNGEDFEWIGRVETKGSSEEEVSYGLLDAKPYQGISYYRLRQLDLDGSFEYS